MNKIQELELRIEALENQMTYTAAVQEDFQLTVARVEAQLEPDAESLLEAQLQALREAAERIDKHSESYLKHDAYERGFQTAIDLCFQDVMNTMANLRQQQS